MRCYICNRVLDDPTFNSDHQDIDPCHTCKEVIADTLAGFGDQPAAPEDEGLDILLEGLYPTIEEPFSEDPDEDNP